MERYLLFLGNVYYPRQGVENLLYTFSDGQLSLALDTGDSLVMERDSEQYPTVAEFLNYHWIQLFDAKELTVMEWIESPKVPRGFDYENRRLEEVQTFQVVPK